MDKTVKKYHDILLSDRFSKIKDYGGAEIFLCTDSAAYRINRKTKAKLIASLSMVNVPAYKADCNVVGAEVYILPENTNLY